MPAWDPIDGETPIDPSYLKNKSIKTRAQLNIAEAEKILVAVVKYLAAKPSSKLAPFDLNWFKQLHKEMFGDIWEYAGEFRKENLNIGIKWHDVETKLYQLEGDIALGNENESFDVFETSVRIHFNAVHIHPFLNGNGRWSRLLGNIYLKQNDHPLVRWPEETIGVESPVRKDYLEAVKKADTGDLAPLNSLHRTYCEHSENDS